jgi:hypothetical protein
MGVLPTFRRLRLLAAVGLVLYTLVLFASPVLHHDLACHLKTPGHCDACAMSPVASRVESAVVTGLPRLAQAGTVEAAREAAPRPWTRVAASGRAPPAAL